MKESQLDRTWKPQFQEDFKIAVVYSGLIQDQYPYLQNIKSVLKTFPKADYFFSTWDLPENKKYDFIKYFYPEPEFKFNPYNWHMRQTIRALKLQVTNNEILDPEQVETFRRGRNVGSKALNQFYGHIHIFEDAMKVKDYDLIIRVRYDTFIDDKAINNIRTLANVVYKNDKPVGVEWFKSVYIPTSDGGGYYNKMNVGWNPMANLPITDGLHDWLIIHRPHHLNVDKFHESIKRRDFRYGEQGWHDLLIRPNNFENNEQTSWLDLVTLRNHRTTDIPRRARIVPHFTEGKHNG